MALSKQRRFLGGNNVGSYRSSKRKNGDGLQGAPTPGHGRRYGHITARLPNDRILSTPHMPPGKVAVRDLIILDTDGKKLEGFGEPNGETAMHTSIYKARPDVQCILHYHADELVAVAATGQEIKVIANCGVQFHRGTPIYDSPVLIRNEQLGDKVAAALGDRNRGAFARAWRHRGGQRPRPAAALGARPGAHRQAFRSWPLHSDR